MYKVKLLNRKIVALGTEAFWFSKPKNFTFKAGQHIELKLINPTETDVEGNIRTLSIANSPHEDNLLFVTRLRETAFKRTMSRIPIGTILEMDGPFGDMFLQNDTSKTAVFFAGGIGITPFKSIIDDAINRNLPHKIFLFYSNRNSNEATFLKEFEEAEENNSNFKFIANMTKDDSWTGEKGYITVDMIKKYIDLSNAVCFIAGPPRYVGGIRKVLNDIKVSEDFIHCEDFSGYSY